MQRRASLCLVAVLATAPACSKPKPPELTPRSVSVEAIRPDGVELSVVVDAYNPNSFPIVANGFSATFELQDGGELGRGASTAAFTIPAQASTALSAKLEMQWTSVSLLAPYALAAKPLPYRVRGSAQIGGERLNLDVPFSIEGQLSPAQVMQAGLRGAGSLLPR